MKVDFTRVVVDLDGRPMTEMLHEGSVLEPLTFQKLATRALIGHAEGDAPSQEELKERWTLVLRLRAGVVDISEANEVLILERVRAMYRGALIYGRFLELFDLAEQELMLEGHRP